MSSDQVVQTILAGREDGVPGNCVQAAVASYLEVPIDAVPHFLLWDDWNYRLTEWLKERGYDLICRDADTIPTRRCIVAGMSPRGIRHVVIGERERVSWDPHPSHDGLTSVDEVWLFIRRDRTAST